MGAGAAARLTRNDRGTNMTGGIICGGRSPHRPGNAGRSQVGIGVRVSKRAIICDLEPNLRPELTIAC